MKLLILLVSIALVASKAVKDVKRYDGYEVRTHAFPIPAEHTNFDEITEYVAPEGQIINGYQASDGQYPWVGRLFVRTTPTAGSVCTGSLLSNSFFLSAEHCMNANALSVEISVGSADRQSSLMQIHFSDHAWGVIDNIEGNQDINLFRLLAPITFTDTINAIRMPSNLQRYNRFHGYQMLIAGFGGIGTGALPRFLQYAHYIVVTNGECNVRAESDGMCAVSYPNEEVTTQGGDSGGPWFIFEGDTPTIIGVHRGRRNTTRNFHRGTLVGPFLGIISDITGIPMR